MFSHVFIGTSDFERALRFYQPLMHSLGIAARFVDASRPWAGWQSAPDPRPLLLIGQPFDGQAHAPGNGQMVAFLAGSRALVDAAHATALAHGGRCEGPPGLRPHYHAHYYGAYFRDPDGNKLAVACHRADDLSSSPPPPGRRIATWPSKRAPGDRPLESDGRIHARHQPPWERGATSKPPRRSDHVATPSQRHPDPPHGRLTAAAWKLVRAGCGWPPANSRCQHHRTACRAHALSRFRVLRARTRCQGF